MLRDVSQEVKWGIALDPQAAVAGTYNGNSIDRKGFADAAFVLFRGDPAGGPDAMTIDMHIEHSDDESTWTDIATTDVVGYANMTQLTDDSEVNGKGYIDLRLVDGVKRYVRCVVVVAFTNGTTPSVPISVACLLGFADKVPVSN